MHTIPFLSPLRLSPRRSTTQQTTRQETIVVIDENPDFVRSMRNSLLRKGYAVITSVSPAEALSNAGCTPDLILCDMGLALRYGVSIFQDMSKYESSKRCSVVLTSWHGTLHDIRFALKIGADDCFAKTVSAETLANLVDARLQKIA